MPIRTKKKQNKSRKSKTAKRKPAKKTSYKKKPVRKKVAASAAAKSKAAPKKALARGKQEQADSVVFQRKVLGPDSGGQSGDLQGLSNRDRADSESVDELLEEGNAFEAEVVGGVENARDADEGEVRTREVPEDDVPDEYLEKDE